MDFISEKIKTTANVLREHIITEQSPIALTYVECPEYKKDNTPPASDAGWRPVTQFQQFAGKDTHYWLHCTLPPIPRKDGFEPRLSVTTSKDGWDAGNPQFTVFLNGKTTQAMDTNHTWLPLEYETEYDVYLYLYTGIEEYHFGVEAKLQTADLKTEALYYDIFVPYSCLKEVGEGSTEYVIIRDCLDKALLRLDLRDIGSADYYESVQRTADYLKTEFYEKECGASKAITSCIGHTHIDVAWLWSVQQTKEKAQRSFSTVLNMMRRYDEYKFMSSQPQLYQYVKENDPALYAEIKQRVKEGRWEAEGAMWLEADSNLVSGESLVRQILYGKRFLREEFGVESNILWLPDVFGYSGALPQILKKSGVDRFFTAKMDWNETNKMPHSIFLWEGIDGSQVFAQLLHAYVLDLGPGLVHYNWQGFKDKSYSNQNIMTFGYGDGGGGPTYEMMENYRRLHYGLPGMPKTEMQTAGAFFDRQEKNFRRAAEELKNTPKWIGEMYLEMHRGTYTTIGKNKRNNRKSELLYQQAEILSVTGMTLLDVAYPTDLLRKNQTTILLNQFHDIIPGSSIEEVYNTTDREYEIILREGRELADDRLDRIKQSLHTDGGVFVYNPTPFAVSEYIPFEGKTLYAENIPAHGWCVIADQDAGIGVTVGDHMIENDLIRVRFNEKYHIVSVYDKQQEREVIAPGAEANVLEVFEDYPRNYDAWEITSYYKQKMWVADDVSDVKLLPDGIALTRKYQKSEIRQKILLRRDSRRIDFVTEVDWHEDHVLLKAAFPVDIHSQRATYDIQFGNVERPTHRNTSWDEAKFEVPAHKWADLSEAGYGVSLLNDCKYGHSIEENVMKLSLLKAPTYPNPEADRGIHQFTYSLFPHAGDFREGKTVREGYLLNMPLEYCLVAPGAGNLPDCFGIAQVDKENIVIETLKKAEEENAVILRLYDAYNQKASARVQVGFDFQEVYLCDLMEHSEQKLEAEDHSVTVPVHNFEIVTLKFVL